MNDESRVEKEKQRFITVERAAWVAVGLLAAALRFSQLGMRPLNESEAVQALAAYRFTTGAASAAPAGSVPVLFTGNVVGFSLLGANDASARWLPALVGLILVLLPYCLRHRLGRGGALAAALLLALSPSAVYFSRSLNGAILVAVCGLAMTVGLVNYVDSRRAGPLYLMAAALGLGLTAGPGTLTLLLIFAAFGLVLYLNDRLLGRQFGWSSLAVAWWALRGETRLLGRAGVVLAATFGLAATALVLHPAGLGHAADLIGAWVQGFLPEPDGQPLIFPLLLLVRYETLILLLGLVEAGWVVLGRRPDPRWRPRPKLGQPSAFPHTAFLAFWAVAAIVIVVVSGHRPAGDILLVVVPLALLAGQGIERAWRWLTIRHLWPRALLVTAVALSLLVFFYLQVASYGQASPASTINIASLSLYTTYTYLILASVALLLLIALGAAAWIWHGPELVVAGAWLTAVVALGLFGLKATWGLGFAHAGDREAEFVRELMVMQATTQDVRDMVAELEALSRAETGDAHTMPITTDEMAGPVVGWYLREFKSQTVVDGLTDRPDTMAAVTLTMHEPAIGETFRGQSFPLRARWLPWGRWGQELVRWLLLGGSRSDPPVVDQEVVLWVAGQP
jgi:uncharacterized protein (TIGR03663 family)